jgi:hypothetical protein
VKLLVILVGFHASESMPESRLLHCVDDHGHDIYVMAVSSSTGLFVLGLVYP